MWQFSNSISSSCEKFQIQLVLHVTNKRNMIQDFFAAVKSFQIFSFCYFGWFFLSCIMHGKANWRMMKLLKMMLTECFRRASVLNLIFSWFDNGPIPWHLSWWFWIIFLCWKEHIWLTLNTLSKGWLKIICQKVDFKYFVKKLTFPHLLSLVKFQWLH